MKNILIFGGRGKLGRLIANTLRADNAKVLTAGKHEENDVIFDMNNLDSKAVLRTAFIELRPSVIVFCQRLRKSDNGIDANEELVDVINGMHELLPQHCLFNVLKNDDYPHDISDLIIINISSSCTQQYNHDVDIAYHVRKNSSEVYAHAFSCLGSKNIRVYSNIIRFGEVRSIERQESKSHKEYIFNQLEDLTGKKIPKLSNIAVTAKYLAQAAQIGICGETITIDSGLSKLSLESRIRDAQKPY